MLQEYSPPSFEIDDINVNTYGILVNWCNFENITITVRQIDELLAHGVTSPDIEKCLHYEIVADIAQQITYNQQGSVPTQTRVRLNLYIFPESVEALTASCVHQGWNQTLNSSSIYYQKNPLISSSFNYTQWRSEYIGSIYTAKIHPYSSLTSHNAVVDAVKAVIEGLYDKYELNPVMTPDVTYWNTPLTKQQGKLTIAVNQNNAVCLEVDTLNSNTPSAAPTTSNINLQNFETGTLTYYTNVRTFRLDSQEELQGWRYYNIRTDSIPHVVSVTPRDTSVDEGGNLEFDIVTENIADGDSVAWSLTNAADFATSSGSTTITSNTGSFTVSPTLDNTTEGVEVFTAEIHYNSVTLASADVTINDTSLDPPPTYDIAPTAVSVDEGSTATFNITTTSVSDGTVLFWEVSRPEDFSTATGYVTISGGTASFTVMPDADSLTEYDSFSGDEDFFVRLRLTDASGAVVATSAAIIINDTSQESTGASAPVPMVVPPSPPAPVGNAGGGTGSLPKGSGIYHEWFQYTSSPSEPTPTWREHVPDTQSVHIDLQYRPALTSAGDAPAGQQPNELPNDSWNAGPSYYLYARWKDKATNISDLITTSFKIDNDDPYTIRHLNANGYDQYACDWIYHNEEVTDDHSGVVYYTVSVNGNQRKEVLTTNYVNPNTYHIDEIISIPSTPGSHNIEVRAYDQAENYVSNSFVVKRSAQTIVWNILNAARVPASPWMVEVRFKATISSNGPHLLEGYLSSMDQHWVVTPQNFWKGSQGQQLELADTYTFIEPDLSKNHGVAFVRTHDPADYWYSAKEFNIDTSQNPIQNFSQITSIDSPTISINDPTGRIFTNSLTNEWAVRVESGNIHTNGGRDFITGYLLTEDSSFSPTKAPEWDGQLQQFVDTAGDGWEAIASFGTFTISKDQNFTFSGTFGTKTVYLWVSTHGHSGDVPGFPQQFFREEYTIEYINDFVGPWCRNIDVEELDISALDTTTKVYSDYTDPNYNPIETYQRDSEVTSDNIRITGEVYDNESWVHRYVLGSYGVPPPYSQADPGVWTVLDPPLTATNFTGDFQLAFPNSMKTHYLWAVDVCGNYSRTMISTELKNPDYVIPTQGGSVGAPYKFEGKADEHDLRESIVSMFGDGVFHTGMISNQTPKVRTNRVHKLSEYRGLRVANTQTVPISDEFLPFPTDPANPQQKGGDALKFSDFLFKIPRIDDLFVNAYIPPDTPTNTTEPTFVGDTRNIALTMDIDSGNQPQEWKSINNNVIDDSATWTASFIPKGAGGSQNINVGTIVQGVIQGFTFNAPGVYIFIGTSSFGKTASRTYIIYDVGTPVPPTQGPPVKVGPIDLGNNPFGQTDIEIDYFVDQVSLAVDVVMCIDRSGSYVPDFSNALYDACFPQPSKKVRLLCATYPGYYGVFAITNNLTSIDTEIKEAFVNLKYLLKDRGPITAADQVSSLSSITSPSGNLASDWPILSSLLTSNGEQIYKLHETATKDELVETVMESAGLQAKEYADGSRDSHNSNSSSNRFNAYWFTDENFAEKTLVTAISQFARNSRTNFSDARFCIVWYWNPSSQSGIVTTTGELTFGDAWTKFVEKPYDISILPTPGHKSLQEGISVFKDARSGGHEPKIEAVGRSATGELAGAWRETAAKLVILFSDETDGPPWNSSASSSTTYTDSGSSSYYRKLLVKNEVGFICFDAGKSLGGTVTKNEDGLTAATNATRRWGGLLDTLTLGSDAAEIAGKMDDAFDLYQAGVTFDLISAINPPVILIPSSIQAKTGAGAHAPGTVAPIPYSQLISWPGGGYDYRKRAVFTGKLDNAAVGSLGTDYIITYISIKNSSGIEIARKEIQIQVKR